MFRENLPIALFVNHESRTEALKVYAIVPIRHPGMMYFSPGRGSGHWRFALYFRMKAESVTFEDFKNIRFLDYVNTRIPQLLASVERLELPAPRWPYVAKGSRTLCEHGMTARRLLDLFTGLKGLLFELGTHSMEVPGGDPNAKERDQATKKDVKKDLMMWLKKDTNWTPKLVVNVGERYGGRELRWGSDKNHVERPP